MVDVQALAKEKITQALQTLQELQQSFQEQAEQQKNNLLHNQPLRDIQSRVGAAAEAASMPSGVQMVGPESILALMLFVGLPLITGNAIAQYTKSDAKFWYKALRKPRWMAPNWLYAPIWSSLYMLSGLAAWMVWTHGAFSQQTGPLLLWAAKMVATFAWPPLFFCTHRVGLALLDSIATLGLTVATTAAFNCVDTTAAQLLIPYNIWMVYEAILNFSLWLRNEPRPKRHSVKGFAAPNKPGGVVEVPVRNAHEE